MLQRDQSEQTATKRERKYKKEQTLPIFKRILGGFLESGTDTTI